MRQRSPAACRCYTGCVRRLIINADDFGLTAGVNRAIARAHLQGIVSSATLMASSQAFAGAAAEARSLIATGTRFSVGCHVVLLDGQPLLSGSEVQSLM